MDLGNSQVWNFALYNGLLASLLLVFSLYCIFIYNSCKNREFGWAFEFAVGIVIATFSRVIERIYYGVLRAFQLQEKEFGVILSPEWIISIVAVLGIIGALWHVRTLSSVRFGNGVLKAGLWITGGTVLASLFYALAF